MMQPADAELAQPFNQRHGRGIVQSGERLVEQEQPRIVQQRALEGQPLAHAAGEPRHKVCPAIVQPRAAQRIGRDRFGIGDAVEAAEEHQVLDAP